MHIAEVKLRTGSAIPWICDTDDFAIKRAAGNAPNGEIVLDPDGKIVRKRFWSDPNTLRSDLIELVGPVETPTRVEDLSVRFRVEQREIASNVVPRIELPGKMKPLIFEATSDEEVPFYAKLRAEVTSSLLQEDSGKLYLGFYLDPLYKVHWNNRMSRIKVTIADTGVVETNETTLEGPEVEVDADIDPRQFLVDCKITDRSKPIELTVEYAVCDDAETFCINVTQRYRISLEADPDGGTRPGVFLVSMFAEVEKLDANGDGTLTTDELPPGKVSLYIGHMDKNADGKIDPEEITEFKAMFNNGAGFGRTTNDGK